MAVNKSWARLALCAVGVSALMALAGCSDGGGGDTPPPPPPPPPPPAVGTVSGVVASSVTGLPLAGVAVSSGSRSTTTDAQGRYTLNDVPAADLAVVGFNLNGYMRGLASVALPASSAAQASPRLLPVAATQNFDAASGATVSVPDSPAQVVLPAAGLVTATGAAASGTVTARVTPINPAADPASMPGNYQARSTGGQLQRIESFGALSVTLADANNAALNLAPGRTATVRIPVATRSADVPATIPLFWFNEQTGLWVQEGTATLQGTAPNQYYEGTVTHFTVWNADRPQETIFVRGCVQDAGGARVAGVAMQSLGSDYSGTGDAVTDASGNFVLPMRRGGVATVFGEIGIRATNVISVGPSNSDIVLTNCLVLGSGGQAPQLVQQPRSQSVDDGGFVFFESQAIGSASLRYQWRRNGVDIAGATSAIYVVFPVAANDNNVSFTVVVSNSLGTVTSDPAVLTVRPPAAIAPSITQQPQDASVQAGQTASFSVVAQNNGGTLSYQWQRDGVDIAGATSAGYTTPVLTLADTNSQYRVVVRSSNGTQTSSSSARLTVFGQPVAPTITQQPANASVNVGQSASFQVLATGTPAPSYQWRRNGVDIAGANSASYITPATVLADSGALFSVVVSNSAGNLASSAATLTVQQPPPPTGFVLVGQAGPSVQHAVTFANGVQTVDAQALLVVNPSSPAAGAITLEPAGQVSGVSGAAVSGTVANGRFSDLRLRYTTYIKGARFYKFDHDLRSGAPQAQLWTSLASSAVCGQFGFPSSEEQETGVDVQTPSNSWAFYDGPGADGRCQTSDDVSLGLRLSMDGSTPPITIDGKVVVSINNASGAITGFVVRSGSKLRQVDSNLAAVRDLFTLGGAFQNYGIAFGGGFPGVWLFSDGNTLYGVNLAAPATRVALAALAADEQVLAQVAEDGTDGYVAITTTSSANASTRVLRVSSALVATPVLSRPASVFNMRVTPTRLVLTQSNGGTVSVLKSDGSGLVTLVPEPTALDSAGLAGVAGENLYFSRTVVTDVLTGARSQSVVFINTDGSNRQELADTTVVGSTQAAEVSAGFGFNEYALFLASPVSAAGDFSGATLRAVELATRTALVTYGPLPTSPNIGFVITGSFDPLQYGQPGLFSATGTRAPGQLTEPVNDLYYFDSDNAGLTRVTSFLVAGAAPQATASGQPRVLGNKKAPQRLSFRKLARPGSMR